MANALGVSDIDIDSILALPERYLDCFGSLIGRSGASGIDSMDGGEGHILTVEVLE